MVGDEASGLPREILATARAGRVEGGERGAVVADWWRQDQNKHFSQFRCFPRTLNQRVPLR